MAEGSGTTWIKTGCLGCAGLALVAVLLMAGLVGVAWLNTDEPQIEDRVLSHDLPRSEVVPETTATPSVASLPGTPGSITLDLANADFEVLPGEPGEALRVEARYDENRFVMEETFDGPEGRPWDYTLRFYQKSSGLLAFIGQLFSGSDPEIRIYLPPDSPIALDLAVSKGGCNAQLGGLWLTQADVTASMGGFILEFDEPLRQPMERLNIDVSMSGAVLERIGNASPRELIIDISMGGAQVDLRGEWVSDADISVTARRSGGQIKLPRNVLIEGIDSERTGGSLNPEVPLPTLRFTTDYDPDDFDVSH